MTLAGGLTFMKLKDFLAEETFSQFESLPDGDTFISLEETNVEPVTVEFEGKEKTRYKLKTGNKEYMVGPQVLRGMQEATKKNPNTKRVRITKTGEKMNTKYTVVAVIE